MQLLKDQILKEGKILEGNILKVDSFINHQMDIKLFNEIGKELKKRFKNEEINKILTIEASGIGIASIVAQYFDFVPVVFAKKVAGSNLDKDTYESEVYSYTKRQSYTVKVSKNYINKGDKILFIDDFLANGCAALGIIDIINQAEATLVGAGIVIEKGFQKGRSELEKRGVRVESLAIIENIDKDKVYFK